MTLLEEREDLLSTLDGVPRDYTQLIHGQVEVAGYHEHNARWLPLAAVPQADPRAGRTAVADRAVAMPRAKVGSVLTLSQFGLLSHKTRPMNVPMEGRRARVGVSTTMTFASLDESRRESAHGTPVQVDRDGDALWEEVLLQLTVRNEGEVPVQIVAVVIESLKRDGELNISQIAPEPLPHVLDPGTRIEIAMQKEPIDMLDNITFFGVTDALGRRYTSDAEEVRSAIRQSWDMPTRVQKFVRRDDPTAPPVLAYQNRERATLIDTAKSSKKAVALIRRRPVLADGPTPPPA